MPGYYLHYAACSRKALKNRSFELGNVAPDILKKWAKVCNGIKGARAKYDSLRTSEMPDYSELLPRILQKETAGSNGGLHYGLSSNPDVRTCWKELTETQKANPFYRGYVWHLLTDAIMYGRLDIEGKFKKVLLANSDNSNIHELEETEKKRLHADWDKTNALVRTTYPEVVLPEEVMELGVVKFINDGELVYVDWHVLKETIDYLRMFDPLHGDMDEIIEKVLNSI